jgi:hypothetical protein
MGCEIIDADVILANVLRYRKTVDMAFLRLLREKLLPNFYLEVDSESINTAVWLHSELFAWGDEEGIIRRAREADYLFDSNAYMDTSYPLPDGCKLSDFRHVCSE